MSGPLALLPPRTILSSSNENASAEESAGCANYNMHSKLWILQCTDSLQPNPTHAEMPVAPTIRSACSKSSVSRTSVPSWTASYMSALGVNTASTLELQQQTDAVEY